MTVQVEHTIKTDELKVNDTVLADPSFTIQASAPLTVRSIDRKIKWTTVKLDNAPTGSLSLTRRSLGDDLWTVVRTEKTPEETFAEQRRFYLRNLRSKTDNWSTDPSEALSDKMTTNRNADYSELVSHWDLDKFLEAQALYKIARNVLALTEKLPTNEVVPSKWASDEDEVLITAWAQWYCENTLKKDRHYSPRSPLSRSTSITSNLFEDMDRWAVEYVISDLAWCGLRDMLVPRAQELLAWYEERRNS